ncbi:MAG: glycine cleavage system protein GcvH [Desulfovibrionales bacterium]|nr:glycine cleavage system protein GcvH [Desulfovibrionales bacterium]
MNPKELLYAESHEWVKIDGDQATMGITDFAQSELGDLTFVELPQVGDQAVAGEEIGSVESVKAASEIYAPVNGQVVAVNTELEDAPELINKEPYGAGWMIKIKITDAPQNLLNADGYAALYPEKA